MSTRNKSTLFLIEQLIVVAVFAICAVACISILTSSYFFAYDSAGTSRALIEAQNAAEIFKATGGDFQTVADLMGGVVHNDSSSGHVLLSVFYDRNWQVVSYEHARGFVLHIEEVLTLADTASSSLALGELSVLRVSGDSLISFPLAAREVVG